MGGVSHFTAYGKVSTRMESPLSWHQSAKKAVILVNEVARMC